jgi:hypothetical protein
MGGTAKRGTEGAQRGQKVEEEVEEVTIPKAEVDMHTLNQDTMPHKLVQVIKKVVTVILVATMHLMATETAKAIPLKKKGKFPNF